MVVLVLYPFYNQKALMHNFALKLHDYGIDVDAICINNFYFEKLSAVEWPNLIRRVFSYSFNSKSQFISRVIRKLSYSWLIKRLLKDYDIVDFHAYYPIYNALMKECVDNQIKFDITLWGSDLMRASDAEKQLLEFGFDNCYLIKMSDSLHSSMLESYGTKYEGKSRIAYFGNSDFPIIDKLTDIDSNSIKQNLYGSVVGKRIVVLGYNGISSQNHLSMLKAIGCLSLEEKQMIHVALPMTYGAQNAYIDDVRVVADELGISYTIFDRFLTIEEIAVIRKTADIVVNVQNTDALAGSLQDHLYCGNVCIFGEWLKYDYYTNNGIYYIKTSMDELTTHIKEVLHNYDKYRQLCANNKSRINNLLSWESTILNQVAIYDE